MVEIASQTVFRRYEQKYLLTPAMYRAVLTAMKPYMEPDEYGTVMIRNLYLDTPDYRLIRRSLEKPVYKEKVRIRCYEQASQESTVYVELKKKFEGVVYKRRIALREQDALAWVRGDCPCAKTNQISREVDYVRAFYGELRPVMFLSYERQAYKARNGQDFRMTFDTQILCRQESLSLETAVYGKALLPEGTVLMELKSTGGIPLWLTGVLSRERIYKTSFSKYGTAYQKYVYPKLKEQWKKTDREETINA